MKKWKQYLVYVMGIAYILAGLNHFRDPGFYLKMMDGLLPYPVALIYVSGVAEVLCGLGLMIPATRKIAAYALIAMLVAIFPANVYMALHPERFTDIPGIILWLRLPLQLPLIWLAYIYTKD